MKILIKEGQEDDESIIVTSQQLLSCEDSNLLVLAENDLERVLSFKIPALQHPHPIIDTIFIVPADRFDQHGWIDKGWMFHERLQLTGNIHNGIWAFAPWKLLHRIVIKEGYHLMYPWELQAPCDKEKCNNDDCPYKKEQKTHLKLVE